MRSRARRRLHIGMRSVSMRTVVTETRLVSGALVRSVVVVRWRVEMRVTRVVGGRARTRRVGTVGYRVAAEQAHVAQRTEHRTAAGRPVRVAVRRVGCETRSGHGKTRLDVVVEGGGMLGFGNVVVAVQVVVGREARRVLDAAWHARRGGSPTAGAVMRTVLVVAVQAGRWMTVRGTRVGVATLGGMAIRRGSSENGRGDAIVVLAVAILVRASRRRGFPSSSGMRSGRVPVTAGSVRRLISFCVRVWSVVRRVAMRRRTGSTAFSLCALQLVELVTGKHGKGRHFAVAGRAATVPELAIGIAVISLIVTHLPSELPVAYMTRFGGCRGNGRRRCVGRGAAVGFACGGVLLVVVVSTALLGVGVDADVAGELIASAETLLASGMCADVRLFAGVSANVTSLVFETVEGTRAERTLVRSGDLRLVDGVVAGCKRSGLLAGIGHVAGGGLSHSVKRD